MLVLLLLMIGNALLYLSLMARGTIKRKVDANETKEIETISDWLAFLCLLLWAIAVTIPPESPFRTIVVKILPKDWFY